MNMREELDFLWIGNNQSSPIKTVSEIFIFCLSFEERRGEVGQVLKNKKE